MQELFSELFSGVTFLGTAAGIRSLVMFAISAVLIYLAIAKDYEPALLLPIGFGAILANLPPAIEGMAAVIGVEGEPGFLKVLFDAGIATELFPILIFIAVGAMIDFTPLFKNPFMIFFGAAASRVRMPCIWPRLSELSEQQMVQPHCMLPTILICKITWARYQLRLIPICHLFQSSSHRLSGR
jgi:hypothetical protein